MAVTMVVSWLLLSGLWDEVMGLWVVSGLLDSRRRLARGGLVMCRKQ